MWHDKATPTIAAKRKKVWVVDLNSRKSQQQQQQQQHQQQQKQSHTERMSFKIFTFILKLNIYQFFAATAIIQFAKLDKSCS